MAKDLNDYAGTIEQVFRQIANAYAEDNNPFGLASVMGNITQLLDADTCAEIIEAAKEQR